jgi:hypothetical protein
MIARFPVLGAEADHFSLATLVLSNTDAVFDQEFFRAYRSVLRDM